MHRSSIEDVKLVIIMTDINKYNHLMTEAIDQIYDLEDTDETKEEAN